MSGIFPPFSVFQSEFATNLGIALIVLSVSILSANTVPFMDTDNRGAEISFLIAILTFYSISVNPELQKLFLIGGLLYLALFPVVVGYIGFRELVISGVYFDQ